MPTGQSAFNTSDGIRRLKISHALTYFRRKVAILVTSYLSPLGWLAFPSTLLSALGFLAVGWHELLALAAVGLIMSVSAVGMSFGNIRFDAHIQLHRRRVSVGDTVQVQVTVDNPGNTSTTRAQADLPIGMSHRRFKVPRLSTGEVQRIDIEFTAVTRAVLNVGPLRIRKGDPFGIIGRERCLDKVRPLYIHPQTVRLNTLNAGVLRDLEGRSSGRIVDDDLDFHGLREYQPGDDIRNVHWLSSAKVGSLMIRQYLTTHRTDTSAILDVNPEYYQDDREFELAVSIHSSIGLQCLLQERPLVCHSGAHHANPKDSLSFLNLCSAIEPDLADNPNLAEATVRYSPEASLYFITTGSLQSVENLKRITASIPHSATCLVLQTSVGSSRSMRRFNDFSLATIRDLDDLALTMGALA